MEYGPGKRSATYGWFLFLPWLNDGPTYHEGMFILEGFAIGILEYLGLLEILEARRLV
jgi:hypothetical protein